MKLPSRDKPKECLTVAGIDVSDYHEMNIYDVIPCSASLSDWFLLSAQFEQLQHFAKQGVKVRLK